MAGHCVRCPPNDRNITLSLLHMVNDDLLLPRGQNDLSLDLAVPSILMWLSVSKLNVDGFGSNCCHATTLSGVMILSFHLLLRFHRLSLPSTAEAGADEWLP